MNNLHKAYLSNSKNCSTCKVRAAIVNHFHLKAHRTNPRKILKAKYQISRAGIIILQPSKNQIFFGRSSKLPRSTCRPVAAQWLTVACLAHTLAHVLSWGPTELKTKTFNSSGSEFWSKHHGRRFVLWNRTLCDLYVVRTPRYLAKLYGITYCSCNDYVRLYACQWQSLCLQWDMRYACCLREVAEFGTSGYVP